MPPNTRLVSINALTGRRSSAVGNCLSIIAYVPLTCSTSLWASLPHSWRTLPLNCFQLPWMLSVKNCLSLLGLLSLA